MFKIVLANTITQNENQANTQAVLIHNQCIVGTGSLEEMLGLAPKAKILDYRDAWLTPGLTDAHIHLVSYGFYLEQIQLKDASSEQMAAKAIAEKAKTLAHGTWIVGGWFDHNLWGGNYPNKKTLDEFVPHHPVMMTSRSGHSIWVNSLALQLSGIHADTANPAGGEIVRDEHGQATGTLLEAPAIELVSRNIPAENQAAVLKATKIASQKLRDFGFTASHTMALESSEKLLAMQTLAAQKQMPLQIYACVSHEHLEHIEAIGLHGQHHGLYGNKVRLSGIKFFTDGAVGPRSAWMFEPYVGTNSTGIHLDSPETILKRGQRSLEIGFDVVVHAIGDRANHELLNVFEKLSPIAKAKGLRLRLEHAQHLRTDDLHRISKLGVIASMQAIHIPGDTKTIDAALGVERAKKSFAFRDILNSGAILALGSDAPVATPDPVLGLEAAVYRQDNNGKPWNPEQAISSQEALYAYTRGAAIAAGWEHWYGKIAPGFAAEFTLWKSDPRKGKFEPIEALTFDNPEE